LESAIRNHRIETYTAQLAVCNRVRAALVKELENAYLSANQLLSSGHRLDQATKESVALQFTLDHLLHRSARIQNPYGSRAVNKP
jgi:hypothetical protein